MPSVTRIYAVCAVLLMGFDRSSIAQTIQLPRRATQDDIIHLTPTFSYHPEYRFQWYLNDQPIQSATNYLYATPPLRPEHLGQYKIVATAPFGNATNGAYLSGFLTNNAMRVFGTRIQRRAVESDQLRNVYAISVGEGDPATLTKYSFDGSIISSNKTVPAAQANGFLVTPDGTAFVRSGWGSLMRVGADGTSAIIALGEMITAMKRGFGGVVVAHSDVRSFVSVINNQGTVAWTREIPFAATVLDVLEDTILLAANNRLIWTNASSGVEWNRVLSPEIQTARVGPNGTAYILTGNSATNQFITKISRDGQEEWVQRSDAVPPPFGAPPQIEVDGAGSVYFVGGGRGGLMQLRKFRQDGKLNWNSSFRPADTYLSEPRLIAAAEFRFKTNLPIFLLYYRAYVSAPWGGHPGHAVIAKYDAQGLRRWERILPQHASIGAEGRRGVSDLTMVGESAIALVGYGETTAFPITIVEDRETFELSELSASARISGIDGELRLTTIIEGSLGPHTNVWRDLNRVPSYPDPPRFVIADELVVPFSRAPTNYFVEVELSNATLALPDIQMDVFAEFSPPHLEEGQIIVDVRTVPNFQFRCLVSHDLLTWSELPQTMQSDPGGHARILDPSGDATQRFYRLIRP